MKHSSTNNEVEKKYLVLFDVKARFSVAKSIHFP